MIANTVCLRVTGCMINLQVKEQLNAMMEALKRADFKTHNCKVKEC